MARKKVKLQWIANDATRRATFKKRRKGLMKKASELATLCGVDACVVVYGEGETQAEVWPNADTAAVVLGRFKAMPELDQCKKMMDMAGFLTQRVVKLREQLHKAQRENRERDITLLMHEAMVGRRPGLEGISVEELAGLGWMVENRLGVVMESIERYHRHAADPGKQPAGQQANVVVAVPPATATTLHQLQMPHQQMSLPPPLVSYTIGGGGPAGAGGQEAVVHQAPPNPNPLPQASWLMEVVRGGGDLGALVYSAFSGGRGNFVGDAGAGPSTSTSTGAGPSTSTSAGAADMLPHFGAGFGWPDAGPSSSSSFPPM